jgi:SAM-dependent methyltransferase
MAKLSTQGFWESFYEFQRGQEWYYVLNEKILNEYLGQIVDRTVPQFVLHCGCGGYPLQLSNNNIIVFNFDFSTKLMDHLNDSKSFQSSFHLFTIDARRLPFHANSFELIIEKGLFDSMTSCSNDSSQQQSNAVEILNEYHRVLHSGGKAILLSIFGPDSEDKDMLGLCTLYRVIGNLITLFMSRSFKSSGLLSGDSSVATFPF